MARPKKNESSENKVTFSPYMLVNAWFRDGNLNSPLPKDIEDGKAFSQNFILYYFVTDPKLFIYINKHFNNYWLFNIPIIDILKMMKMMVYYTGFRQKYTQTTKKEENKLCGLLKKKFPYYKNEEISMIVDIIDNDDELQSTIYENFGIRNPDKRKNTAKQFKSKLDSILSKETMLENL